MFFRAIFAVVTAVLIIATSSISSGIATDKTAKAQVPGVYSFRLGEFTIVALSDGTVPQDLDKVLTNANSAEVEQLLDRNFLKNPVEASINAFPIDTKDRQMLVDTGAGQLFGPGLGGKLQMSLKAAGYAPDEIDTILLTHIHADRSGGLVENGQLMFPNATVYVGKPDVDLWLDPTNAERFNLDRRYFDEAVKTVKPYLDAGKLKSFSGETAILPGITAYPTPGHTPGHSFYLVESGGKSIEFCGDIIHFASLQFANPEIAVVYDVDANAALSSIGGHSVYPTAAVYCATKFAVRAISEGLRQESTDIRVTIISPGVTESELPNTITDAEAAQWVEGFREAIIPASAIARAIAFAIEQPDGVDVSEIIVRPTASP